MRTLLAAFSVMMLVGAASGCGDDTTTMTHDMAASLDMSTPVMHDMMQLNCVQIFICTSNGGGTGAALQACTAEGKPASQQAAGALAQCAIGACSADGGVDGTCVGQTITAALALTGGNPSGACASQGTACRSN